MEAVVAANFMGPVRGIAPDAHVWVETALGSVVLGLTRQLAAVVGERPGVAIAEPDEVPTRAIASRRSAQATPPSRSGRRSAAACSPSNPRLASDPGLLARDPEGAG